MILSSAPGKLYIAGEYAVVEPGYPAILVAINRLITISLEKTLNEGSITAYNKKPISLTRKKDKLVLTQEDSSFLYIMAAIDIVEAYAKEKGRKLDFYRLKVISQLQSPEGKKYGLGSSAAIIVATVEVLCKYYKIDISQEELFKLSSLAQLRINKNSSCGDIAASVYGGWIVFKTFDKSWLLIEQEKSTISEILNKDWPGLLVESLTPPENLRLVIGWTGNPASTIDLVANVKSKRIAKDDIYREFLFNSKKCVEKMVAAFKNNDIEEIQRQIKINRKILIEMGNSLDVLIETPILNKLCNIASKYNGYAKSSGAGGGDCGIVIFNGDHDLTSLIEEWKRENIIYLPLKVYEKNK